jgi:hypothetical protein
MIKKLFIAGLVMVVVGYFFIGLLYQIGFLCLMLAAVLKGLSFIGELITGKGHTKKSTQAYIEEAEQEIYATLRADLE